MAYKHLKKLIGLIIALVGIIVGFWNIQISTFLMVEALVIYLMFADED